MELAPSKAHAAAAASGDGGPLKPAALSNGTAGAAARNGAPGALAVRAPTGAAAAVPPAVSFITPIEAAAA